MAKRAILLDFLQDRRLRNGDSEAIPLSGLIQSWHFAVQASNDSLCSSIPACFALLLKSISSLSEFRECGNVFCRILLRDDHLDLFNRGLSAHRHKEYLIDPCLRLLTEIVLFDGGSAAKLVYRQKETTFQRLDVFLAMRNDIYGEENVSRRRASIREIALRYLFANLRLQGRTAKSQLLTRTHIVRSIFQDIADDPPWIIQELLPILKRDIQEDAGLSRVTKAQFFSDWTLGCLATLYNYRETTDRQANSTVKSTVHAFLLFLCTCPPQGFLCNGEETAAGGVLYGQEGTGSDDEESPRDSCVFNNSNQYKSILRFLKRLRPHANVLEGNLILDCFRTTPSLIVDYFSEKLSFTFDPKLTATWIGYSRFLLATIQLPLPESLWQKGVNEEALIKVLMGCVLPQPLTQKVLTRCLNQSSPLITFLTARILSAAFGKFTQIINMLRSEKQCERVRPSAASERVIQGLFGILSPRCPETKHVYRQFRSCSEEKPTFREAIARLLAYYLETLPAVALEEKLNVSVALSVASRCLDQRLGNCKNDGLRKLELRHLFNVAVQSPDMQWWHKPGVSCPRSLFVSSYFDVS